MPNPRPQCLAEHATQSAVTTELATALGEPPT